MATISILMAVYNERPTVEAAIADVLSTEFPVNSVELIVVDDGSTDGTRELLLAQDWPEQVRTYYHERNLGKGRAVRTALEHATGQWSIVMDADLEYESADLPRLLQPLLDGEAEAVFGTRGFQAHSAYGFWYVVGNKFVTFAANLLYNSWISDIMTCHKAMSTELFRSLPLRENGFGIEPEITARLLQGGHRIFEMPVVYRARQREEGKKLTLLDGARVLRTLIRCRVTGSAGRPGD